MGARMFNRHNPYLIFDRDNVHTEANFEARRGELGVADELKDIPGITALMLVVFGEQKNGTP